MNTTRRYLVLAMRTSAFAASVIELHRQYLDALRAQGRLELTGPFTDQSGGAYLLRAETLDEARALVADDPLALTGASNLTIKEWAAR